jgi:hypothetical protein
MKIWISNLLRKNLNLIFLYIRLDIMKKRAYCRQLNVRKTSVCILQEMPY